MREKKEINVRVGANIQRLREERHYTQEELSEKLGVTPNHLSAIERGVSGISLELMERLCHALGATADHILFGHANIEVKQEDFIAFLQAFTRAQQVMEDTTETIREALERLKE